MPISSFSSFSSLGGTFALYSLLCRHAKVKTIPNQHRTDEELTTYSRNTFHENSFAAKTKKWLEAGVFRKNALLVLVLASTCMVIGDGILTPAISGTGYACLCFICFTLYGCFSQLFQVKYAYLHVWMCYSSILYLIFFYPMTNAQKYVSLLIVQT